MAARLRPLPKTISKRLLVGFVAALVLLAAASPEAQGASLSADRPVWDEIVASLLGPLSGQVGQTSNRVEHRSSLGWNKTGGQRLIDASARLASQMSGAAASAAASKQAASPAGRLTFRSGYQLQTSSGATGGQAWLDANWVAQAGASSPSSPTYGVIQFAQPFDTDARYALEKAGVKFYNFVGGGGLYARVPAAGLAGLQSLAASGAVLYAGPIPPAARTAPALSALAAQAPDAELTISLQLFDPPSQAQMSQLEALLTIQAASLHPALPLIQGSLRAADLPALAALPFVRWIEPAEQSAPLNFESTQLLGADVLRAADPIGSTGAGVQVGVMDTGIMTPAHPDLDASRVIDQFDYFPGNDAVADDTYGHGTHVTGVIGGSGAASGADLGLQGQAPGAQFLIYKLCCSSGYGYFDEHFQDSLIRGAAHGMDISNNSWGGSIGLYTTAAEIADRAVRGEYGRPALVVAAAGNDNNLVRAPGTAKNVITVGAVKSGNWPNQVVAGCGDTNWPPAERICFSNYGPIDVDGDGQTRVKPDLMADGVMVRSTTPFGYVYYNMTGTSLAAPAVSGAAAALLDHYSDSAPWLFDWPETVKAILLASAVDLGDSNQYGRGLLDAFHAAYAQPGITAPGAFWGNALTATGQAVNFTFEVPDGYTFIRLALTWPDPAGGLEVANDLDLHVFNNAACAGSPVASAASAADSVEFINLAGGPGAPGGGTWCAQVAAASLISVQTFGLAEFATLAAPALSLESAVDDPTPMQGQTFYLYTSLNNSGSTAAGSYVRLALPAGFTLEGARGYTADGRSHFYNASELYTTGNGDWHFATGQAIAGYPRLVRWTIRVEDSTASGPYLLNADPGCRCTQLAGGAAATNGFYVFVGGQNVYLPLVIN